MALTRQGGDAHPLALWTGVVGPPLVWFADLTVSYPVSHWACHGGHRSVLFLVTVVALLLTAGSSLAASRGLPPRQSATALDGARPADRAHFMAVLGLLTSAFFALVLIANAIPRFVFDPCQP
jgi:hypothetical protein